MSLGAREVFIMRTKLFLVVALSLSVAALTSFAQQSQPDSTSRGTTPPPVNPNDPYITHPNPTTPSPGGSMQTRNFDNFRNLSDGQALGVICAIDSMEINAAMHVQNDRHGKNKSGTSSGKSGTSNSGAYGGSKSD